MHCCEAVTLALLFLQPQYCRMLIERHRRGERSVYCAPLFLVRPKRGSECGLITRASFLRRHFGSDLVAIGPVVTLYPSRPRINCTATSGPWSELARELSDPPAIRPHESIVQLDQQGPIGMCFDVRRRPASAAFIRYRQIVSHARLHWRTPGKVGGSPVRKPGLSGCRPYPPLSIIQQIYGIRCRT